MIFGTKVAILLILFKILEISHGLGLIQNAKDDWVRFVRSQGYHAEAHEIQTTDGYILRLHRLISRNQTKAIPYYLQHGVIATSGDFIVTAENSLGFLLSDNGYDVWFGNVRGNKFSLKHRTMSMQDPKYWDFSFHEMGIYDVPTMIDYVLKITQSKNVFYVGHSQGGSAALVMLSTFREFNDIILQTHLLGPASFMGHAPIVTNYSMNLLPFGLEFFKRNQVYDLLVNNKMYHDWANWVVDKYSECTSNMNMCKTLYQMVVGFNKKGEECDWYRLFLNHHKFVSTTLSMKQVIHYGQLYETDTFRQFDYDNENKRIYGKSAPPDYILSNIKSPVYLYVGVQDAVVGIEDTEQLKAELPNVKKYKRLFNYNHGDLVYGANARKDIYLEIMNSTDQEIENQKRVTS